MNLKDMIRFDSLRYKATPRTVPEEVEYQALLERVVLGADGKSEFDTSLTEGEKKNIADMNKQMHDELCSKIAQRFFKDLALYGPAIGDTTMKIVAQIIKTLKP